jgi:putative transposase
MPSRNEVKEALPQAIYHVYNRGVERRRIYLDGRDYQRFLLQLCQAVEAEPAIELLAYCLMPNHFHMLLRQTDSPAMGRFMQRLGIAYVMYFNRRHHRVGPLFQGKYKAVRVIGSFQLMEVSRYIHRNPEHAGLDWRQHTYSSQRYYLDSHPPDDLENVSHVLACFDQPGDYWPYLKLRS